MGEVYDGRVVSVKDFGAFVEILPGQEGLLHISEIDHKRVAKVDDYLQPGDRVQVKLLSAQNGKLSLSRKALLKRPEGQESGSDDRRPRRDDRNRR